MPEHAEPIDRARLLPEAGLPDAAALIAEGRALAGRITVGPAPFLAAHGVACEADYKRARAAEGTIMLHAQVGYRDPEKSRRAFAEIYQRLARADVRLDRYGICLDWSMGYPAAARHDRPRGTGLILKTPEDFAALTAMAPVAPHFGDFVIGTPASVENTAAALEAGATAIGNLGQYFTFRMPEWDDDIGTTAETVKALALIAAQGIEVIVHSNLDDGFAALFSDLACALGAALIERHVVEGLIGANLGHCYGHTFTDPLTRLAFQCALARVSTTPGTMIYGNTTAYGADRAANYAALGRYLRVDIHGQRTRPTGHALNPVPVSEAERIPEIDEIVDAHLFAARLIAEADDAPPSDLDPEAVEATAARLVEGGEAFRDRVLAGLVEAGIDTDDAFVLLLALRRIGGKRLEALFGPGAPDPNAPRGRRALVRASAMDGIEGAAEAEVAALDGRERARIAAAGLVACVASTDVHEYGKLLVEAVLDRLGVARIDGGVSSDPDALAERARSGGADFIALGTYNGVALVYLAALREALAARGLDPPVFIGGKLNQIPEASNTSLPMDVGDELAAMGAIVCREIGDMLRALAEIAGRRK